MDRKLAKEDWDALLDALERLLKALGVPVPLTAAKRVLDTIKRRTQDGKLKSDYEREKALELIEEAIDPLAGAALEHAAKLDDLELGQEGIRGHLDQIVELLRVLSQQSQHARDEAESEPVFFEGPRQAHAKPVPSFTGRDPELSTLEELLLGNRTVRIVVTGIGGVGKTSLVKEFVATRAPDLFPAGAAWLDGTQIVSELARVSRRFGWAEKREPDPTEAVAWLERTLHTRPVLLVIDDFDAEHEHPAHLPNPGGQCRTIVTTRSRTAHLRLEARRLQLGLWTLDTCRQYLRDHCDHLMAADNAELKALVEFVGRLPLGIRWLVSISNSRPSLGVSALLSMLRKQPLDLLDQFDHDRGIKATFRVAYDDCAAAERRLLQALGTCANQTRADIVGAVAQVDTPLELLDDLHVRGFVEFTPNAIAPWGMHDVIRIFVNAQTGRDEIQHAHLAWVREHIAKHAAPEQHREFAVGTAEATRALERLLDSDAPNQADAVSLYTALTSHLRQINRYWEVARLSQLMSQRLPSESGMVATCLGELGVAYRKLGQIPSAIECFSRALTIFEGRDDIEGRATQLNRLGLCYRSLSDFRTALDLHHQSLALHEQIDNRKGQAEALNGIGRCLRPLGQPLESIEMLERALDITKEIHHLEGQANALQGIGLCHRTLGDVHKAIDYQLRSLTINETIAHVEGQATALGALGMCYRGLGLIDKAIDAHLRALAIHKDIGRLEGEANALDSLGRCHRTRGDLRAAIDCHFRSLEINQKIQRLEGQASDLTGLGFCYQVLGNYRKAIEFHSRALEANETMGRRVGQGYALCGLGTCHRLLGEQQEALEFLTRARATLEKIKSRDGVATVLLALAGYHRTLGDTAQCIELAQEAHAITSQIDRPELQIRALTEIATCRLADQDSAGALELFEQALALEQQFNFPRSRARIFGALARYHHKEGNLDLSIDYHRQTIRLGAGAEQVRSLAWLSVLLNERGDISTATKLASRAHSSLAQMDLPEDHRLVALVRRCTASLLAHE